ncbi:MipA/OmpV family protein [Thioclava sp.]|uniref:MipA/OmpV family protein n=1 Tax=Thioclava sp. TaxID=1933450 RepID=UPI003AA8BB23
MMKSLTIAAVLMLPVVAHAGGFDLATTPAAVAPAPVMTKTPDLIFRLGAGVSYGPSYFGSDSSEAGPTGSFSLQFLRAPGGKSVGSETGEPRYGFAPRASFRVIGKRSAKDHPELTGMKDVPLSVEVGFGLGYASQNFEAFGNLRYGAIGHEAWVGELGADLVLHPSDRLTLKAGPRVVVGSNKYNDTYFGVTAAESVASAGALAAYNPGSGVVSAGIEVGATYALNDTWSINGAVRYDRFQSDAKDSPIVAQGSADQVRVIIGASRLFSFNF